MTVACLLTNETAKKIYLFTDLWAVKDGKIIATGSNAEVMDKYESENTLNLGGQFVYPGLIDAHAHFLGYGQSLFTVDLFGAESWEEVIKRVNKNNTDKPTISIRCFFLEPRSFFFFFF